VKFDVSNAENPLGVVVEIMLNTRFETSNWKIDVSVLKKIPQLLTFQTIFVNNKKRPQPIKVEAF
jgi:hypothetical protein